MSDTIWLALIVIAGSVVTWLLARMDRREDWRRQDKVAADARDAKAAVETVRTTLAAATRTTNDKLDVIHVLVNSTLTAAKQAEYDATASSLVLMREVVRLNRAAGEGPNEDALAAIEQTEAKLGKLHADIADRVKATVAAQNQQTERTG
jgi:hypothetical protein